METNYNYLADLQLSELKKLKKQIEDVGNVSSPDYKLIQFLVERA